MVTNMSKLTDKEIWARFKIANGELDQLLKEIREKEIKDQEAWYRQFYPELFIEKKEENENKRESERANP